MKTTLTFLLYTAALCMTFISDSNLKARDMKDETALDRKVQKFLDDHRNKWHDLNVPSYDGKLLYDLIIKNRYRAALEIGTSTGHSGIWIAWALSKTGGKLVTIESDEQRHREALSNFKDAGLSAYIDARLGDAHDIVKELKGPFDFIFSDADKEWYKNYFIALSPKLKVGGCFTAHNVRERGSSAYGFDGGIREFYDYVKSRKNYETTVDNKGSGVSISYKKSE